MIPVKLFQRLTDYEEEYLNNPTRENYDRVTNLQVEIDWPYKANQEQLDYWNRMNHDPDNSWLEGTSARRQGQPISSNPYKVSISSNIIDRNKVNRWSAGWADQDMIYRSERCPKCNGELDITDNSKQCHKCEMLWPISFEFKEDSHELS